MHPWKLGVIITLWYGITGETEVHKEQKKKIQIHISCHCDELVIIT